MLFMVKFFVHNMLAFPALYGNLFHIHAHTVIKSSIKPAFNHGNTISLIGGNSVNTHTMYFFNTIKKLNLAGMVGFFTFNRLHA